MYLITSAYCHIKKLQSENQLGEVSQGNPQGFHSGAGVHGAFTPPLDPAVLLL